MDKEKLEQVFNREKIENTLNAVKDPTQLLSENARSKFASAKKLIIISLVLFLLLWFNIGTVAELLVSKDNLKADIEEELSEIFSKEVEIKGEIDFKSSPEPNIILRDVFIKNPAGSSLPENFVHIKKLYGRTTLTNIFAGSSELKDINIENIEINSESTSSFLEILKSLKDKDFDDSLINIKNANINLYRNNPVKVGSKIKRYLPLENIQLNPNPDVGTYLIRGNFYFEDIAEKVYFDFDLDDGLSSSTDIEGKIYSSDSEVKVEGELILSNSPSFKGEMNGEISGFSSKVLLFLNAEGLANLVKTDIKSKLKADISYTQKSFNFSNAVIAGDEGTFKVNIGTTIGSKYTHDIKFQAASLFLNNLLKNRKEFLASKKVFAYETDFQKRLEEFLLFSVNEDTNFNVDISAADISLQNREKGSFSTNLTLEDRVFKIVSLKTYLPGKSQVKAVSKIKIDKENKTLSGFLDFAMLTQDMGYMMKSINPDHVEGVKDFPIKDFFIKSKAYIYDKKIHFREIVSKINDSKLAGQLQIDYTDSFAASSAFIFDQLEIDKYFKDFSKKDSFASKLDFIRVFDSIFDIINISLSSKKLMKSGILLEDFSMFSQVKPGVMDVKDVFFYTPVTGDFRGSAKFDISEFQPKINLNLVVENFDMDYLIHGKKVKENDKFVPSGSWSKSQISLTKLSTLLGNFDIRVENLKLLHMDLKDFRTSLVMLGDKIQIKKSRFEAFNSKLDFEGVLTTEYPSFSLKFEASDLDFNTVFNNFLGINEVAGKFNASGVLSSTGYSVDELVSKLSGRLNLVTNSFLVNGFNIHDYSSALANVVRVEQVQIISDQLLNSGRTQFGYLGTSVLITAGKMIFNNIPLQSVSTKAISSSGIIDFYNWKMKINTDFVVKTVDGYDVPISAVSEGSLSERSLGWNYDGAKKYWEEKFYGGRI